MSTKVKGDAIKEGSIPLSALDADFKKKIKSSNVSLRPTKSLLELEHTIETDADTDDKTYTIFVDSYLSYLYGIEFDVYNPDFCVKYGNKVIELTPNRNILINGATFRLNNIYDEELDETINKLVVLCPYNTFDIGEVAIIDESVLVEDLGDIRIKYEDHIDLPFYLFYKIDENSIPQSALSADVQKKLSTKPNWESQEGESGYIANKPFSDNIEGEPIQFGQYKSGSYINIYDVCFDKFGEELDDKVYAACFFPREYDKFAINLPVKHDDQLVSNSPTVISMENIDSQQVFSYYNGERGIEVYLFYAHDSDDQRYECIVIPFWDGDISDLLEKFTTVSSRYIQTLDEKFIPDTIARKTDIPSAVIPDWNAEEGEAGYIENKPGIEIVEDTNDVDVNAYLKSLGNKFKHNFTDSYDGMMFELDENAAPYIGEYCVNIRGDYQYPIIIRDTMLGSLEYGNTLKCKIKIWDDTEDGNWTGGYLLSAISLDGDIHDQQFEISNTCVRNFILNNTLCKYTYVNKINASAIEDNVLKAIPQIFNDEEREDIWHNMGLEPVVWKYLCDPIVIYINNNAPEELLDYFSEEFGYSMPKLVPGMIRGLVVNQDDDANYRKILVPESAYIDSSDPACIYFGLTQEEAESLGLSGKGKYCVYVNSSKKWAIEAY